MTNKKTSHQEAMLPLERLMRKMAREKAAWEADVQKITERAAQIKAGSRLQYHKNTMSSAFHVFIDAQLMWKKTEGDWRDYLSAYGVSASYGLPTCSTCKKSFTSHQAYAIHMLSGKHIYKTVTPGEIWEVRAHIQAFPIDDEDYKTLNPYKILQRYEFRNC